MFRGRLYLISHNTNDYYQLKKQIEEAVASGKLAHLMKDIRQNNQQNRNQGRNGVKIINMIREEGNCKKPFEEGRSGLMNELTFLVIPQSQLTDEPIILEGIVEGNQVRRILVDGGSSSEIMYEHCFRNLDIDFRSRLRSKEDIEEVFTTIHECPNQYMMMGATLITNWKQLLADILRENIEVFAWIGSESTAIPRFVMEHQLKIYPLAEPVVHKRRPVAPEGILAQKERVFCWLGEGLTRKDMYPFPKEGEELASLMGYPYKCFLQHPKEYNQIRMAEEDEEKTGFHTEEGVFCFTHMPKELKNSAATLHRMMEKVLADQRG
ncbi:hypothetical protein Tco_0098814 [Tanacetum coccineum]